MTHAWAAKFCVHQNMLELSVYFQVFGFQYFIFASIKLCLRCVSVSKYFYLQSSIFLQASKFRLSFYCQNFGPAVFNIFCRHQNSGCQFIPKYFGPAVFNIDSGQQGLRQVNKWLRCLDSGGRAHKECDSNNQQSPFQESSI